MSLDALLCHRPGEVRRVTSAANDAVKAIRALDLKKHRAQSGLFVAEGARTLIAALAAGAEIVAIAHLAAAAEEPAIARIRRELMVRGGLVLEVDRDALEKLSRRDNPQTIIGVVRQRWLALDAIDLRAASRFIALEEVRDPGNLGTILRTADALGAGAVILIGDCTDPFGVEAVRASMGSIFAVPLAATTREGYLAWRTDVGALVVGTHPDGAIDVRSVPWRDPTLLVMGNEQRGLSAPMAVACDVLARIPMRGEADSLNLAAATAITLFESIRASV